jgi:hypothetical protein
LPAIRHREQPFYDIEGNHSKAINSLIIYDYVQSYTMEAFGEREQPVICRSIGRSVHAEERAGAASAETAQSGR